MKQSKSSTVSIFIGLLLVVVFAVGLICSKNPGAFMQKNYYDISLEQFCAFCVNWWIPAGVIGIPLLLVSLILSLRRESRNK